MRLLLVAVLAACAALLLTRIDATAAPQPKPPDAVEVVPEGLEALP